MSRTPTTDYCQTNFSMLLWVDASATVDATATVNPRFTNTLSAILVPRYETEEALSTRDHKLFCSMIGSLMYFAVCTLPDISLSVANIARQLHAPADCDLRKVKLIFRYVAAAASAGLFISRISNLSLFFCRASADVDLGRCKETSWSTPDLIVAIKSGPVVWRTKNQTAVSTYTAKLEYIALCERINDVSWLRKLWWTRSHLDSIACWVLTVTFLRFFIFSNFYISFGGSVLEISATFWKYVF